jgi:hypothetical protein
VAVEHLTSATVAHLEFNPHLPGSNSVGAIYFGLLFFLLLLFSILFHFLDIFFVCEHDSNIILVTL